MFRSHQPHILFILADDYGWNDIGKEQLLLNLILYFKIKRTDGGLRTYVSTLTSTEVGELAKSGNHL